MATTPYPLPRGTRETAILLGDGATRTFGPFDGLKIFDIEDVLVWTKPQASRVFRLAGATVAKTSADAYAFFTVTFPSAPAADTKFLVQAARVTERSVAVTRAGAIDGMELEKELSKQATSLLELRRDVNRVLRPNFGQPSLSLLAGDPLKFWQWNASGTDVQFVDILRAGDLAVSGYQQGLLGAQDQLDLLTRIGLVDATSKTTSIGINVRPTPLIGDPLSDYYYGTGTVAVGSDVLLSANNTATLSTVMGHQAGQDANDIYVTALYGLRAGSKLFDTSYATALGGDAMTHTVDGNFGTALGAHAGTYKTKIHSSLVAGAFAGFCAGEISASVVGGYSAAGGALLSPSVEFSFAGCVIFGTEAGLYNRANNNILIGDRVASASGIDGPRNIILGRYSGLVLQTGTDNVVIGDQAGVDITSGSFNTVLGRGASVPAAATNSAAIGQLATCTGDNQVQLGNPSTTTYAYGAVQDRSDKRDKLVVGEVDLGEAKAIVLGAAWQRYRVNYRERYAVTQRIVRRRQHPPLPAYTAVPAPTLPARPPEISDASWATILDQHRLRMEMLPEMERRHRQAYDALAAKHAAAVEKDNADYAAELAEAEAEYQTNLAKAEADREAAARAGKRIHMGVLAQDEHERLGDLGIDFAGIQHHARNGGSDIWSVGYQAYIPVMGVILQDHERRLREKDEQIEALTARLAALSAQMAELLAARH